MHQIIKYLKGRTAEPGTGFLNVLIVDDVREAGRFMKDLLAGDAPHFSVAAVGGGLECLEHLRENEVDCIVADYHMPGMDGIELLRTIRATGSDVPLIIVTGHGSESVAREAFKNGAYDYFTREAGPWQGARIINSIEQAVRRRVAERSKREAEEALVNRNHELTRINIENALLIDDLKKKESRLRSRYQQLYALHSVAEIIAGSHGLDDMLSHVLEKTLSLPFLDVERKGVIFLRDETDPDRLNMAAHKGVATRLVSLERRIRVGQCLCGRAALTGKVIRSRDCFTDPGHTTRYPGMKGHGHIVVPIKGREGVSGVMTFYLSPGTEASRTEERILCAIASQLAVVIENHRLRSGG